MKELSSKVTKVVNDYIESGMTTEEILGVLCGVAFRVMAASVPAESVGELKNAKKESPKPA